MATTAVLTAESPIRMLQTLLVVFGAAVDMVAMPAGITALQIGRRCATSGPALLVAAVGATIGSWSIH
ncbi:hypothetical protein HNC20_00350 [Rhodococcus rhodochrous]|uniref:hypothetical protein n=1 Tax=Rhodococcus rhodochrous TaxID=1829 RepID=UPI000750AD17|nr:hypothetical protein [Rhodococcus rhodochrous]MDO1482392.1 hypothetical protein [Rhodococcus rhodochrous]